MKSVNYNQLKNRGIFICSFLYCGLLGCNTEKEDTSTPNVLLICVDDLNTFIGCMGYEHVKTPNIDRLASQGVLFSNAHAQAPLSGPSRASVMTGLRPSTTGIYGQINDDSIMNALPVKDQITFLPQYFREHGYKTMGVGKIFHNHAPKNLFDLSGGRIKGFGPRPENNKYFRWNKKGTSTDWGAFPNEDADMPDYQSAQWAIEQLNSEHSKPFFLAVGFLRPHVPWYVPQKWFDMYDTDEIATPPYYPDDFDDIPEIAYRIDDLPMFPSTSWAKETGEWKNIIHAYLACITFVDHYIGQVLDALEKSPYAKNTIVVLWSDNGYRIGEKGKFAKHCLWKEGTQVPLLFKGPGIPEGKTVKRPTELLSIYPTLLELCNLPKNKHNEGKSLLPLIKDPDSPWDHAAITTWGLKNHSVTTDQFRFIQYEDGSEELYDHQNDPNEWYNIAALAEHEDLLKELRKLLPQVNRPWARQSSYTINKYFTTTSTSK